MKKWDKIGWLAMVVRWPAVVLLLILIVVLTIMSCERWYQAREVAPRSTNSPLGDQSTPDGDSGLKRESTRYWLSNTRLFMRALLSQENGPTENRWNITEGFLTDACEAGKWQKNSINLANPQHVKKIIQAYLLRYQAQNDQHAAAMFRKGPSGSAGKTGQDYGWRVQNTLWTYEDDGIVPLEELGGVRAKTKSAGCPIKVAIDENVEIEVEYD